MDTGISIMGVLRITKKQVLLCVLHLAAATLFLPFGLARGEGLGLGGGRSSRGIYPATNHGYYVILQPLTLSGASCLVAWWYGDRQRG